MIRPPEIPNAPRAIQKGVPLKYILDESAIYCLALNIYYVYRTFDVEQFCKACNQGLEPLSLMERAKHIAIHLREFLPERYSDAIAILVASFTDEEAFSEEFGTASFFYLPHNLFISEYGLSADANGGSDPFESSMAAIFELTKRFTAEFAIRDFIIKEQQKTLLQLQHWVLDENPHIRRLCSEGTRPKLPWAKRIKAFIADPQPTTFFLDTLKDDDSLYVRRSVANHLGDIAKDHPETVYSICSKWLAQGATAEVKWVIRHALRYPAKKECNRAIELRQMAK